MGLIDDIRAKYPKPRTVVNPEKRGYCVGGALCMWLESYAHRRGTRFPGKMTLSDTLKTFNPSLSRDEALRLAHKIITENNDGAFEEAWDNARFALEGGV